MTLKQIVDMVLAGAFDEAKRAQAEQWVDAAYGELWSLEEWQFRTGTATITSAAGGPAAVSVPADFNVALYLTDDEGFPLRAIQDQRQFQALYGDGEQGEPEAFTVMGLAQIMLGPTPDSAQNYTLLYEKRRTQMVSQNDEPALPSETHMALVFGAKARGCMAYGIPLWQGHLEAFDRDVNAMRKTYLSPVRGEAEQAAAYRP